MRTSVWLEIGSAQILEAHGTDSSGSRQKTSGKPPDLTLMLKATKHQLSMWSFRVCCLALMCGRGLCVHSASLYRQHFSMKLSC